MIHVNPGHIMISNIVTDKKTIYLPRLISQILK